MAEMKAPEQAVEDIQFPAISPLYMEGTIQDVQRENTGIIIELTENIRQRLVVLADKIEGLNFMNGIAGNLCGKGPVSDELVAAHADVIAHRKKNEKVGELCHSYNALKMGIMAGIESVNPPKKERTIKVPYRTRDKMSLLHYEEKRGRPITLEVGKLKVEDAYKNPRIFIWFDPVQFPEVYKETSLHVILHGTLVDFVQDGSPDSSSKKLTRSSK